MISPCTRAARSPSVALRRKKSQAHPSPSKLNLAWVCEWGAPHPGEADVPDEILNKCPTLSRSERGNRRTPARQMMTSPTDHSRKKTPTSYNVCLWETETYLDDWTLALFQPVYKGRGKDKVSPASYCKTLRRHTKLASPNSLKHTTPCLTHSKNPTLAKSTTPMQ